MLILSSSSSAAATEAHCGRPGQPTEQIDLRLIGDHQPAITGRGRHNLHARLYGVHSIILSTENLARFLTDPRRPRQSVITQLSNKKSASARMADHQ